MGLVNCAMSPGNSRSARSGVGTGEDALRERGGGARPLGGVGPDLGRADNGRAGAHQHLEGLVEVLRRYRKVLTDHPHQLLGLAGVQVQHRGDRQEEEQAQAGQRVPVAVHVGAVAWRREVRVAERDADLLTRPARDLEVDERDAAVRAGQEVVRVQVVDGDATLVYPLDRVLDGRAHLKRPPRVLGDVLLGGALGHQRVLADQLAAQWHAVDEVHDHEMVSADGEVVTKCGHRVDAGQRGEDRALALLAGDRVDAVGGEPGVRAGLLQYHLGAGAGVPCPVDATAVGEMQRLLDLVRQVLDRRRGAGLKVGFQEARQAHPRR